MNNIRIRTLGFLFLILFASGAAHAQATRTWISGVGDDANPCSSTAPCKTFAGAISKTAAAGEISVLDPGGFGAVTITKSITLSGDGTLASILVSGTPGVTINAPGSTVILRNLSINGISAGTTGVNYLAANQVIVDNCTISGFATSGIDAHVTGNGLLLVSETKINGGTNGVLISSGNVNASLDRVSIRGTAEAVHAQTGTVDVSNSIISQNSAFGIHAEGSAGIDVESSMLTGNNVAAQADTGAIVRLLNNDVFNNSSGFGCGGGILASAGNNRKANNVGGSVPVCAPTVSINVQ